MPTGYRRCRFWVSSAPQPSSSAVRDRTCPGRVSIGTSSPDVRWPARDARRSCVSAPVPCCQFSRPSPAPPAATCRFIRNSGVPRLPKPSSAVSTEVSSSALRMSPSNPAMRTCASSSGRLSVWSRVSYCQPKASFTPPRSRTGRIRTRCSTGPSSTNPGGSIFRAGRDSTSRCSVHVSMASRTRARKRSTGPDAASAPVDVLPLASSTAFFLFIISPAPDATRAHGHDPQKTERAGCGRSVPALF